MLKKDARDNNGQMPLYDFVSRGWVFTAEVFILGGVDIEARDDQKMLHSTLRRGTEVKL